jgi:hypothetical protein
VPIQFSFGGTNKLGATVSCEPAAVQVKPFSLERATFKGANKTHGHARNGSLVTTNPIQPVPGDGEPAFGGA